jgi:hypothetical protein
MVKIPLSLNPDQQDPNRTDPDSPQFQPPNGPGRIPVIGAAAIAFGILGIFTKGYIFVPLAMVASLIALFMGQISWAFIGLLLSVAGLLTSPVLLAILGISLFLR